LAVRILKAVCSVCGNHLVRVTFDVTFDVKHGQVYDVCPDAFARTGKHKAEKVK